MEAPREPDQLHLVRRQLAAAPQRRVGRVPDRLDPMALACLGSAIDLLEERVDLDRDAGLMWSLLGVELEVADLPGAEVIERLAGLIEHGAVLIGARDRPHVDQDRAETPGASGRLLSFERGRQGI